MRVDAGWGKWLEMNHSSWLTKAGKGGLILKRQFSYCVIIQNYLLSRGDAVMSTVVSQQEGPGQGMWAVFLCSCVLLVNWSRGVNWHHCMLALRWQLWWFYCTIMRLVFITIFRPIFMAFSPALHSRIIGILWPHICWTHSSSVLANPELFAVKWPEFSVQLHLCVFQLFFGYFHGFLLLCVSGRCCLALFLTYCHLHARWEYFCTRIKLMPRLLNVICFVCEKFQSIFLLWNTSRLNPWNAHALLFYKDSTSAFLCWSEPNIDGDYCPQS